MTDLQLALKTKHSQGSENFLNGFFAENTAEIIEYGEKRNLNLPFDEVKFLYYWWWLINQKVVEGNEVI